MEPKANVQDLDKVFAQTPQFEGEKMQLGKHTVVVPALGLGAIKRHRQFIMDMTQSKNKPENAMTMLSDAAPLIHAALVRNYPGLVLEQVEDLIDMRNFQRVFAAIMQANGLNAGNPVGEAPAASAVQ